jgi:hypothetical protein
MAAKKKAQQSNDYWAFVVAIEISGYLNHPFLSN